MVDAQLIQSTWMEVGDHCQSPCVKTSIVLDGEFLSVHCTE